jgi:hypothetical protein
MRFKYVSLILLSVSLSACATNNKVAERQLLIAAEQDVRDAQIALLEASNDSPWIFVGHSVNDFDYYININTIKKYNQYESLRYENGNVDSAEIHTKAWWRVVKTDGDYDQLQTKFYCSKNAAINISGVMYSKDSIYKGDLRTNNFVESVIPDTVYADILKMACELSK